jgi:hypothetical protein
MKLPVGLCKYVTEDSVFEFDCGIAGCCGPFSGVAQDPSRWYLHRLTPGAVRDGCRLHLSYSDGSPLLDVLANFAALGRERGCRGFADGQRDGPSIHVEQALFPGIRRLPLLAPTRGEVCG